MNGSSEPGSSESFRQDRFSRQLSVVSLYETDDEPDEGHGIGDSNFVPGPLMPLKEQLELDKEDESLRRWKEQLLGCIDFNLIEEEKEPEVIFLSLGIVPCGHREMSLSLPLEKGSNAIAFTLKEGSKYSLKFTFMVRHNIVSGLVYENRVWKAGFPVDQAHCMMGTFSPQREPYVHVMEEETAPSGALARGSYTAKTKFVDDDRRCHLEVNYSFEIKKDW